MDIFRKILTALENKQAVQVLTVVAAPAEYQNCIGNMLLVYADGTTFGQVEDDDCITKKILQKINTLKWQKPGIIEIDNYKIFWDTVTTNKKVIIFGCGHISQALAKILAVLEFAVTVIDDRREFANVSLFPTSAKVICDSFGSAVDALVVDQQTAVIIATRGHRYDLICLKAVIQSEAGYIGMMGSKSRVNGILHLLKEEGMAYKTGELKAPIGLDIGANTPAEIALSVAAEVVAHFNGGRFLPLSRMRGEEQHG